MVRLAATGEAQKALGIRRGIKNLECAIKSLGNWRDLVPLLGQLRAQEPFK